MTVLRWILVGAGCVLLAAIYLVGRMRRTSIDQSLFDRGRSDRRPFHSDDSSRDTSERASDYFDDKEPGAFEYVPQLDEAVKARPRPEIVSARASNVMIDDLPSIHAGNFQDADADLVISATNSTADRDSPSIKNEPVLGELDQLSTGAFIASQVQAIDPNTPLFEEDPAVATSSVLSTKSNERGPSSAAASSQSVPMAQPRPMRKPASRKIVALRLAAGAQLIEGARLKSHLDAAGLRHGKYNIYHRFHTADSTLFSVASMVEPGTFDPQSMSGMQFPGVTLFTQLPGPIDSEAMFTEMLTCARQLEHSIGGLLQDERGLPLTEQRAQRLRDDIADFTHLLGQANTPDPDAR